MPAPTGTDRKQHESARRVRGGTPLRLAIIGEQHPGFAPHDAVERSVLQAAALTGGHLSADWVATDSLEGSAAQTLGRFDAIWVAPGSPYRNFAGALGAIRYARENGVPLLGTCGGFQYIVVEFGRNVLGLEDAGHQELDPSGTCLIVTALRCKPAGQTMPVRLAAASRPARWYGTTDILERYFCNYGINPEYARAIDRAGLVTVGRDPDGEPRVVELTGHPFFVGVLFVPQPVADERDAHPLVAELIRAAVARRLERAVR